MRIDGVIRELVSACQRCGGQSAFAKKWGISPAYVSDVINGRREPGPGILIPLGLQRSMTYEPLPDTTDMPAEPITIGGSEGFPLSDIGMSLEPSVETIEQINEIERNSAEAMRNAGNMRFGGKDD